MSLLLLLTMHLSYLTPSCDFPFPFFGFDFGIPGPNISLTPFNQGHTYCADSRQHLKKGTQIAEYLAGFSINGMGKLQARYQTTCATIHHRQSQRVIAAS